MSSFSIREYPFPLWEMASFQGPLMMILFVFRLILILTNVSASKMCIFLFAWH